MCTYTRRLLGVTDWKWIVPPLVSFDSRAYLGLSAMTEYTLKPNYL